MTTVARTSMDALSFASREPAPRIVAARAGGFVLFELIAVRSRDPDDQRAFDARDAKSRVARAATEAAATKSRPG